MTPAPLLPRFEIRRFLGRGALGDVYLAWDRQRSEEVALKVVRTTAVPPDMLEAEKNGTILQRELAAISPQVPKIFDSGEENDLFWISMEYIEGVDLAAAVDKETFTEERAARVAVELCEFLEKLHGLNTEINGRRIQGVVHGDLKPENLRLQQNDCVRVLDFGIAKQLSLSRSFTYQPFGSLPYLPPERLERGTVDRLSDLWAVGVILYLMVTGQLPFAGTMSAEVEQRILKGERRPLPNTCSRLLHQILHRSLDHSWECRYPSAAALKKDLAAFLTGTFIAPAAEETRRTIAPQVARTNAAPVVPSPVFKPRRRGGNKWLSVTLGLLLPLGACQAYIGIEGRNLQRDLLMEPADELPNLWQRYQIVQKLDLFQIVPAAVGKEMKAALARGADRVLSHDLDGGQLRSQEDWKAALNHLQGALQIDPADSRIRAKVAYCRSQLALAEAKSFAETGDLDAAARRRAVALNELAEASRIDETWPEPYVQRSRIYIDMEPLDLARVEAELEKAGTRGYPKDRLISHRAEGHLTHAQQLYSEAVRVRGTQRERDLLAGAIEHFSRAIDLYDRIPGDRQGERNRATAVRVRSMLENRYGNLPLGWGDDVIQGVFN